LAAPSVGRAVVVAGPAILLLLGGLFAVSYLVTTLLGLPSSLGIPAWVGALGAVLVVGGLAEAGWVFVYRAPASMIVSTYITFRKLFVGAPVDAPLGRTEPLVVVGPQRYLRHPLYSGVIVMTFGWALLGGSTFVLIGTLGLLLWCWLVLIPFEERELKALFGEQYERYMKDVPMLVPFTKRKR
jgi:protein-S-isoprenylcysteine O-methyltransferase Ste14